MANDSGYENLLECHLTVYGQPAVKRDDHKVQKLDRKRRRSSHSVRLCITSVDAVSYTHLTLPTIYSV